MWGDDIYDGENIVDIVENMFDKIDGWWEGASWIALVVNRDDSQNPTGCRRMQLSSCERMR